MTSADPSPGLDERLAAACALVPCQAPIALVRIGDDESELDFADENGFEVHARLRVGARRLVDSCLRHSPPEPVEVERAIDVIEDALMEAPRFPRGATLVIDDARVRRLLSSVAPRDEESVIRMGTDDVESAFMRMAAVSLGSPADANGPGATPPEAALLLILREVMHHLGLASVVA